MATQYESARIILELYNLRREETMRKARDFFVTFNPETAEDLKAAMFGPNSAYIRQVLSYWEMASSLVLNNAIDAKMFAEANGEHLFVFAKIESLIPAWREIMGNPNAFKSLEAVVLNTPNSRQTIDTIKVRIKEMLAARAAAAKA